MKSLNLFLVAVLLSACAHAQSSGIFRGNDLKETTLSEALSQVTPGSVVVIGENHGLKEHQRQQIEVMSELRRQGRKVAVGMEFFTYTEQGVLDSYQHGTLSEADFLTTINWKSPSFEFYRDQTLFPNLAEGAATVALNAPRTITGKVAKTGLTSLTEEETSLLPPQFSLGRASYKERFLAMMPHLPNPESGDRYFAAQSIWDDTMAWQATEYIKAHPEQVMVIVVGEFHVAYGGGLPDRIHVRAPQIPVVTVSQINTLGLSDSEIKEEITPEKYGIRSQLLILSTAKGPGQ